MLSCFKAPLKQREEFDFLTQHFLYHFLSSQNCKIPLKRCERQRQSFNQKHTVCFSIVEENVGGRNSMKIRNSRAENRTSDVRVSDTRNKPIQIIKIIDLKDNWYFLSKTIALSWPLGLIVSLPNIYYLQCFEYMLSGLCLCVITNWLVFVVLVSWEVNTKFLGFSKW